jgi:hypothetical protein
VQKNNACRVLFFKPRLLHYQISVSEGKGILKKGSRQRLIAGEDAWQGLARDRANLTKCRQKSAGR